MSITIHRYAPLHLVDAYVQLGWVPHPSTLLGTPHGVYRMHVEFICCCGREPPEPIRETSRREPRD